MFYILKRKLSDWRFEKRMARQRKKKGFADCDCWGMYYWFGSTFPKMIRTLRDMKHGAPAMDFEEVDNFPLLWVEEECNKLMEIKRKDWEKQSRKYKKENPFEDDEEIILWGTDRVFDRWQLILSRIAYCLEQTDEEVTEIKNEYEDEYFDSVFGKKETENKKGSYLDNFLYGLFEPIEWDEKGRPKLWRLKTEDEKNIDLEEKYRKRNEEIAQYREDMKNEAFDLLKKYFYHLWD